MPKKPKILFHASRISNLKELHSIHNLTNNKNIHGEKWTYAATTETTCSAFSFLWDDSHGIKFGLISNTPGGEGPWLHTFKIPKKLVHLMEHPCSVYTLTNTTSFIPVKNGLVGEYRSAEAIIPIHNERKFKTSMECMKHFGVIIRIF